MSMDSEVKEDKFLDPLDKERIEMICSMIDSNKVLNIGSQKGDDLTKYLKKICEVITVDLTKNTDIRADLDRGIPVKGNSFDCIVAGEIIEHLYNTKLIIREINRVLKKGGVLILSVPNICSLRNRIKVLFGGLPIFGARGGHIREFNLSFIKELLIKNGFKVIEEKTNGVWFRGMNVIPSKLCPASFGEHLIIKAKKVGK